MVGWITRNVAVPIRKKNQEAWILYKIKETRRKLSEQMYLNVLLRDWWKRSSRATSIPWKIEIFAVFDIYEQRSRNHLVAKARNCGDVDSPAESSNITINSSRPRGRIN